MQYRLNKDTLLETLRIWSKFLKRKVHLIACGGTALTLLDIKESTKDIDFLIPQESEYDYLIKTLQQLGYVPITGSGWARKGEPYLFDLFRGKRIHTTELLNSPLEPERNILVKEFSTLYIGVLNYYDLIVSKLFRGAGVDFEDCLTLVRARRSEIDLKKLEDHFFELAAFDISEERIKKHWDHFIRILKKEK